MPVKDKKWKGLIIISAALFFLVMLLEIMPRLGSLASMAIELIEENRKLDNEKNSHLRYKELAVENMALKDELKGMTSGYTPDQNISSVISLLDSVSLRSRSRISSIMPGKSYRKDNLVLQPLEVNLTGSYENTYNLIRFLETAKKVILIKSLVIIPKEALSDSLNIKTELEVYVNL